MTDHDDPKAHREDDLSLPHHVLPPIPIGHPDTMMSPESVRRAVEDFRTRPTDVVVATFAKTGTTLVTWLCHLIRLYHGHNTTTSSTTTDPQPHFDLPAHLASLETFYQVVPWPLLSWDIGYDPNREEGPLPHPKPRVFKSHLRLASIYRGPGVKYIVTIRNPAATALSFYNFFVAKQVPLVANMDASTFLMETPLVRGRPGRASLWDYYREYHLVKDCPAVLMLVYEDVVEDMPQAIRQISRFMDCPLPEGDVTTVAFQSTKAFMAQYTSLLDEPYERAKSLNRVGDLSQLAPGPKVVVHDSSPKATLHEAAQAFLTTKWQETMTPLGYHDYDEFVAMIRTRNQRLFS